MASRTEVTHLKLLRNAVSSFSDSKQVEFIESLTELSGLFSRQAGKLHHRFAIEDSIQTFNNALNDFRSYHQSQEDCESSLKTIVEFYLLLGIRDPEPDGQSLVQVCISRGMDPDVADVLSELHAHLDSDLNINIPGASEPDIKTAATDRGGCKAFAKVVRTMLAKLKKHVEATRPQPFVKSPPGTLEDAILNSILLDDENVQALESVTANVNKVLEANEYFDWDRDPLNKP